MKNARAKYTLDLTILLRKFRKVTGAPLDWQTFEDGQMRDSSGEVYVRPKGIGHNETVEAERLEFQKKCSLW
jgi:hypothetical protein